ncbi:DUF1501 domain-containing protein [Planctomycetes bacterium K23_9]|uniref:Sulfatase n=1 Tax=Stieleria marina TaxID=1930275 RepID=A0A517P0P6_9BACT|nr:hypothetical protein K239x_49580 [Planctomycetes bacterium K23_9]
MKTKRCDGFNRRDVVRVGGLSALGIGLGNWFAIQRSLAAETLAAETLSAAKAKSCILIWLDGGPSHLESFDPKPDAPEEVRGPLSTIATNLAGVRIGECLPQTAQMMDKIAVVRSMTSPLGEHNFGTHYLMTGYKPTAALAYPTFGSTLASVRAVQGTAAQDRATPDLAAAILPPSIAVPRFTGNISGNGFLPSATAPFEVGGNPDKPDFQVRDLDFYQGLDLQRLDRRRQVVAALDRFSRTKDASADTTSDPDLERAYNLIASPEAKRAFDLSREPDHVRNRYGRGAGNSIGQSCLLARRLVQRGVPFVTVFNNGWDTHKDIRNLKSRYPGDHHANLPSLDRAFAALVGDLSDRGMLDETLVVVMGEFGRTPKINATGGRDHWPNAFSVALAGGGIRGGQVYGSSDAMGEYAKDKAVTPSDLAATIYTLLGVDPSLELHTRDGRPVRVSPDGARIVKELIA